MKHLQQILEGVLDSDSLDNVVDIGVHETAIFKLLAKWNSSMFEYNAKKGTDSCGNKLGVGDWVMSWSQGGVEFGKIIQTFWEVTNGHNLLIMSDDKPLDYYKNGWGELCPNATSGDCLKLSPQAVQKILKELCR